MNNDNSRTNSITQLIQNPVGIIINDITVSDISLSNTS